MRTENIESVMVDGRWVMQNQKILLVNESEILEEVKRRAPDIVRRAGIQLPG